MGFGLAACLEEDATTGGTVDFRYLVLNTRSQIFCRDKTVIYDLRWSCMIVTVVFQKC